MLVFGASLLKTWRLKNELKFKTAKVEDLRKKTILTSFSCWEYSNINWSDSVVISLDPREEEKVIKLSALEISETLLTPKFKHIELTVSAAMWF